MTFLFGSYVKFFIGLLGLLCSAILVVKNITILTVQNAKEAGYLRILFRMGSGLQARSSQNTDIFKKGKVV